MDKRLLLLGAAAGGLYFLSKSKTSTLTDTGTKAGTAVATLADGSTGQLPVTNNKGVIVDPVNQTVKTATGKVLTADEYKELSNPNHHLTLAEAQQYFLNYPDVVNGTAKWSGGLETKANDHWKNYGCAEGRTYYPLVPPSINPGNPTNSNDGSGNGNNWIGPAIGAAASIITKIAGVADVSLTPAEVEVIVTSGAIIKDLLPYFQGVDAAKCAAINNKVDYLVKQYV
ncbi:MAG: hypothetical protein V4501_12205 [Pseudomonadota bacterium]